MVAVLNGELYSRLLQKYGSIRIANLGERATVYRTPVNQNSCLVSGGEYYRICCPFCNDDRYRLWVNHRYGTEDETGRQLTHLAICYNEDCLSDDVNREEFKISILSAGNRNFGFEKFKKFRLSDNSVNVSDDPIKLQEYPGACILSDVLPDNHKMIEYFSKRGFGRDILERFYVSYCVSCDNPEKYKYVVDRAIIPFYRDSRLISWQARNLDSDLNGRVPKYYTCPGSSVSASFYNFDTVLDKPFCILVEGVLDAWALPDYSVAVAGKSVSARQLQELSNHFSNRPVLVMFDGSARAEIDKAVFKICHDFSVHATGIYLPGDKDPAEIPSDELKKLITNQAAENGVIVNFK